MSWRTCPTTGCHVIPPDGFTYCSEHAGTERWAYDLMAERDRYREALEDAHRRLSKYDMKGPKQVGRALGGIEAVLPYLAPAMNQTQESA